MSVPGRLGDGMNCGRGSNGLTRGVTVLTEHVWDGGPAAASEVARVFCRRSETGLHVEVEATFHGDPRPSPPAGSTDRLWEYEVVELFLAGSAGRYLEIELGPYGHYLVLSFAGVRRLVGQGLPLEYTAVIEGRRWLGRARLDSVLLPEDIDRVNAYAIHGTGSGRRYLAAFPVPGPKPDFHQPQLFGPLVDFAAG